MNATSSSAEEPGATAVADVMIPKPKTEVARLVFIAIVMAALTFRIPVSSVGALLPELQKGLGLSSAMTGVLTSLPVICFGLFGMVGPFLARRLNPDASLTLALSVLAGGLIARALAGSVVTFFLLSLVALAGAAVGNVLLPTAVVHYFPRRVGLLTGAYTAALAIGVTIGAGLSLPIARLASGWRYGLGVWGVLAAVAAAVWLWIVVRSPKTRIRHRREPAPVRLWPPRVSTLVRTRLGWAMAVYFGTQSLQTYVMLSWFGVLFRDAGMGAADAGAVIAFLGAMQIPTFFAVPPIVARLRSPRPMIVGLGLLTLVGYLGILWEPVTYAWLWAFCLGVGGGAFALSMALIGLYGRDSTAAARLSAFTQGAGYLLAAAGPVTVGVIYQASGSWTWPVIFLLFALVLQLVAGLLLDDIPPTLG